MVRYLEMSRSSGQLENAVGWYHSHPGYGCWLSGIDVGTQHLQQQFNEPFLAVVIDPHRTISSGKVEIGAFRTYPEGHKSGGDHSITSDGGAAVPMGKAADFGAHAHRYYPLEVSHYKSTLDSKLLEALWNKYWVQTLSSSPLFTNRNYVTAQIQDLAGKTTLASDKIRHRGGFGGSIGGGKGSNGKSKPSDLSKIVDAAEKIANEERMGLISTEVKEVVFGRNQPQQTKRDEQDTLMADAKA